MANETISIIDQHTKTINDAIAWSIKYEKVGFPTEEFKNYRRQIATMRDALTDRCAIAAYGESQVGKSYLMSSLLSSPGKPFVIENQGETYSFIDDLNPSGGSTVSTESTGVITRFTTQEDANPGMKNYVHVRNFSVVDIVLLLVDSFYNDMKDHKVVSPDKYDDQLQHIVSTCKSGNCQTQSIISEDDIRTIDGSMGLPKSPSMDATSANMLSPPPSAIDRLLRSNQHDVKKHSPDRHISTQNAPTLSNIICPYESDNSVLSASIHAHPVTVVMKNIAKSDPTK